jgi:membrane-bound inhibitor of C-type lysozyme
MEKNKNLVFSVIIVIATIAAGIFLMRRHIERPAAPNAPIPPQAVTISLACKDSKTITATFHIPEDQTADLVFSDGRTLSLPHAVSADGARYANADESIVFWTRGNSAFVTEKGTETYSDCTVTNIVSDAAATQ